MKLTNTLGSSGGVAATGSAAPGALGVSGSVSLDVIRQRACALS
jgi:hypothetical protein